MPDLRLKLRNVVPTCAKKLKQSGAIGWHANVSINQPSEVTLMT